MKNKVPNNCGDIIKLIIMFTQQEDAILGGRFHGMPGVKSDLGEVQAEDPANKLNGSDIELPGEAEYHSAVGYPFSAYESAYFDMSA
jgi:hypothetical protein